MQAFSHREVYPNNLGPKRYTLNPKPLKLNNPNKDLKNLHAITYPKGPLEAPKP